MHTLVSGLKKANSVETHFRLAASSLQSQCSEDDDDSSDKPFYEDESGKRRRKEFLKLRELQSAPNPFFDKSFFSFCQTATCS